MKLLSRGNPKTVKGEKLGYLTHILHLAPANASGYNVCPMASEGCTLGCLNTSGRGRFEKTQNARIRKTKMFFEDRSNFMLDLVEDVYRGIRRAEKLDLIPVFRFNGTSDIRWETVPVLGCDNIMGAFPDVQFYDYTKIPNRRNVPENYHLTFSRSEDNDHLISTAIGNGMNIAVVFGVGKNEPLPTRGPSYLEGGFGPLRVVDGDETDLRFLDPDGVIVGLRAKGKAKLDESGFVVRYSNWIRR